MDFIKAKLEDMEQFYALIDSRIKWMDEIGIKQWNHTGYWERYPKEYYLENMNAGRMFVLTEGEKMLAVGVIYEEDERWVNSGDMPAYYLHHFASDVNEKGSGSAYLEFLEQYSRQMGKLRLRLDCAVDNPKLNDYYESRGYYICGSCIDGPYEGITREKVL